MPKLTELVKVVTSDYRGNFGATSALVCATDAGFFTTVMAVVLHDEQIGVDEQGEPVIKRDWLRLTAQNVPGMNAPDGCMEFGSAEDAAQSLMQKLRANQEAFQNNYRLGELPN